MDDDPHHRDNWPFVIERKPVPQPHSPVSPTRSIPEGDLHPHDDGDDARANQADDKGSISPAEVSPIQSSRSSLDREEPVANADKGTQSNGNHLPRVIDDLYEDDDEERDIITPIPSAGLNGGAEHTNPFDAEALKTRSPPVSSPQSRSSSILKSTTPTAGRNPLHRTPSITAQIPLNRQRVRYSWQSVQDEEPNRPRINVIKLVSNTATASAAFPQGEAFGFSISPGGRRIAAFNSARLYILQSQALPVGISQDYALKRRPLAVEVVDEGNTIAILADEYTVNVYDLEHQLLKRIKTIKFDNPTYCIALSPTGGLLAAGYEGGVEVFSLAPDALATDRRAVRSQRVDRLIFSKDGSALVGTTTRINASSTVVISVPVFPTAASGMPTHEELKEAWCSELLQPENIRNSSHATFLRENREACNDRLFAWNGLQETFGILRIPDMMYTNTDFPVVINPPLSTLGGLGAAIHCCPDVDEYGDAVAMVVNDRTIRLYLVPKRPEDNETIVEAHSIDHELDEGYGCPFTDVRWVQTGAPVPPPNDTGTKQVRGRLIVASPGAVIEPDMHDETMDVEDLEGGRIIMFDFDAQHIGQPRQTFSLTLGTSPPQRLEEPDFDVAHEVAIIRRRTVNQNKSSTLNQKPITLGRSATSSGNRADRRPRHVTPAIAPTVLRRSMVLLQSDAARAIPDQPDHSEAAVGPVEEPYAPNAPRSAASLQRAASNVQRHRFQTLEEKTQEQFDVESSSNFIALPEYTEEPNAPLPSRFRAMAGLDGPSIPPKAKPTIVTNPTGDRPGPISSAPFTAPAHIAENFSREEAFAVAKDAQRQQQGGAEQHSSANDLSPLSGAFASPSRSGTSDSLPGVSRSSTVQIGANSPRFVQRAYGHAAFNPMANSPPPALIGEWENAAPLVASQIGRPLPFRQPSVPQERAPPVGNMASGQEQYDDVSPLPRSSPIAPQYPRPPLSGPQYRFSTPQFNSSGNAPLSRGDSATLPRAPSSAGSWAPSPMSSTNSSYRETRLPPHMQAFRNAAVASAAASNNLPPPPPPPTQAQQQTRSTEPRRSASNNGYPITAWHPPAPSPSRPTRSGSLSTSNRNGYNSPSPTQGSPSLKAKNSGFFRRGTKKHSSSNPNLLFGSEFASKQPGARPSTSDSVDGYGDGADGGGGGAKSMFETKSIFTVRTKRGETKCVVM